MFSKIKILIICLMISPAFAIANQDLKEKSCCGLTEEILPALEDGTQFLGILEEELLAPGMTFVKIKGDPERQVLISISPDGYKAIDEKSRAKNEDKLVFEPQWTVGKNGKRHFEIFIGVRDRTTTQIKVNFGNKTYNAKASITDSHLPGRKFAKIKLNESEYTEMLSKEVNIRFNGNLPSMILSDEKNSDTTGSAGGMMSVTPSKGVG